MNVIDVISPTLPALLNTIDGRVTTPRHFTLHTANATIVDAHEGFLTRFLSTLINPNIVSLLFLAGLAGLGFELFHPGVVIPGAFGAICMITALFGFSVLPLSWAGLALVLFGVALLVIDLHVPTHGALTLSGLVAMAIGMITLFHNLPAPYHTSEPLIIAITVVLGGLWAFAISKALTVRRRAPRLGAEEIVGMEGVMRRDGLVFVRGELWRAASDRPLREGEQVQVEALDGLSLRVRPI
jgi:membrane-bound serine protease (ClpP class)